MIVQNDMRECLSQGSKKRNVGIVAIVSVGHGNSGSSRGVFVDHSDSEYVAMFHAVSRFRERGPFLCLIKRFHTQVFSRFCDFQILVTPSSR